MHIFRGISLLHRTFQPPIGRNFSTTHDPSQTHISNRIITEEVRESASGSDIPEFVTDFFKTYNETAETPISVEFELDRYYAQVDRALLTARVGGFKFRCDTIETLFKQTLTNNEEFIEEKRTISFFDKAGEHQSFSYTKRIPLKGPAYDFSSEE